MGRDCGFGGRICDAWALVVGAFPLVSSESPISSSGPLLLCRRRRFGATLLTGRAGAGAVAGAVVGGGLGGPGAMGTTPPLAEPAAPDAELLPTLVTDPAVDFGDSESVASLAEVGVATGVCTIEFFLDDFFDPRVEDAPVDGIVLPLPLLRFLITSVFSESGRTTPCSFRNRPHALQRGCPSGFRLHNGVVCVKQFVHVVGAPPFSPSFVPPGLVGLEGAAEVNPDSGGEFGDDCGRWCIACGCIKPAVLGVDAVRGIFCRRGSFRLRMSLTDTAEPLERPRLPGPFQPLSGDPIISVCPMVTCFRGGPAGYRAGTGLNWLERFESHWNP